MVTGSGLLVHSRIEHWIDLVDLRNLCSFFSNSAVSSDMSNDLVKLKLDKSVVPSTAGHHAKGMAVQKAIYVTKKGNSIFPKTDFLK